jgi:hypothetical protein
MAPKTLTRHATSARFSTIALGTAFLIGCGGGHTASPVTVHETVTAAATGTTSATPNREELAREYLRIVAPANAAHDALIKKSKSNDSDTTAEQLASDLAPVIAAYEEADNALLRVNWPPSIEADVKALVAANGTLIGDLRAADIQDVLSSSSWATQVSRDGGRSAAAANIVRADLGLPPMTP